MRRTIIGVGVIFVAISLVLSGCFFPFYYAGRSVSDAVGDVPSTQTMGIADFEKLLAQQPLAVTKTKYVVQADQYKMLFPDMLQAILTNNTTEDIKDAVVAFVAWDENNLPVKIEGQFDFYGSYIRRVAYSDINLASGDTFGEDSGYSLSEGCEVDKFKAIAVSFETVEGETWDNPYYEDFCSLYEKWLRANSPCWRTLIQTRGLNPPRPHRILKRP